MRMCRLLGLVGGVRPEDRRAIFGLGIPIDARGSLGRRVRVKCPRVRRAVAPRVGLGALLGQVRSRSRP